MIAIVSSNPRERAAFAALCASRHWPSVECDSLRAFRHLLRSTRCKVVLTRHKLADGYSDDVFAALESARLRPTLKVIVLLGAGASPELEARQVSLGADSVHRDPVRTDVLAEYFAKFRQKAPKAHAVQSRPPRRAAFPFGGATIQPVERRLCHSGKHLPLTPREVQLAELLFESRGEVVTYPTLYHEVLGIRFTGDTGTMRVLLAKLDTSFRALGLVFRRHLEVIPKTGYRYKPLRRPTLSLTHARGTIQTAAA